jgi:hypothetical protein
LLTTTKKVVLTCDSIEACVEQVFVLRFRFGVVSGRHYTQPKFCGSVLRVGLDLTFLTEDEERQGVELNFAYVRQCCESHRHPPVTVHSRRTTTNNQQPPNPITMLSNFEFQNRCLHPPQPNLSSCRSPTPCNILHPEHCSSTSPKSTFSRRQPKFSEPNRSEPTASPPRLALLAPEPSSNAPATSHLLRSRQENSIGRACIAPLNPAARHITTSTQRRLPSTDSSRPWLANHHFSSKPCWHAHGQPRGGMSTVMSISDGAIQGEGCTAGWKFGHPTQKRPSEPPYNGKLTAGQENNGKANAESKVCGISVLQGFTERVYIESEQLLTYRLRSTVCQRRNRCRKRDDSRNVRYSSGNQH